MIVVGILSGDYVSDEAFYSFSRARVWDSLLGTLLGTVFLLSSSGVSSSLSFIFLGLSAEFTTALLPFIDTLLLLSVVSSAVFVCSKHCNYKDKDEYDDGDEYKDEDKDEDKDNNEGEYVVSVSLSCLPASVSLPSVLISSFSDNLSSSGPLFSTLGNVTSIIPVSGIWCCSLPPSALPVDAALFPTKSLFLGRVQLVFRQRCFPCRCHLVQRARPFCRRTCHLHLFRGRSCHLVSRPCVALSANPWPHCGWNLLTCCFLQMHFLPAITERQYYEFEHRIQQPSANTRIPYLFFVTMFALVCIFVIGILCAAFVVYIIFVANTALAKRL
jgi:hypothetical protein